MNKLISAMAAAALLAAAGAASAGEIRLPYGDLDLASAAGARAFDLRVARAARNHCSHLSGLNAANCGRQVRLAIMAEMPAAAREDYAGGRGHQRDMAGQAGALRR